MADSTYNILTKLSLNSEDFKNSIKNVKDNVKDLALGVDGANGNLGELRKSIMLLKNTSFVGKTAEEIRAINQQIGNLTDEMADLKAIQKGMGQEFGTTFAKGLQGLTAMAEIGTGVASMFGASKESSEQYQKVMVQLIGVSQAFATVQSLIEEKTLVIIAMKIRETAASVAQTTATYAAAAAQWALNSSLIVVTGTIGAVVVVVGALTAGIYLLVSAHREEAAELAKKNKEYVDLRNKLGLINDQEETNLKVRKARGETGSKLLKDELNLLQAQRDRALTAFNNLKTIEKEGELSKRQKQDLKDLSTEWHKLGNDIKVKKAEIIKASEDEAKKTAEENAKAKGSYELLTMSVENLKKKMQDVIANGGVVTPEMIKKLSDEETKLKNVNAELEKNLKLSQGRVDEKMEKITTVKATSVSSTIKNTTPEMKGVDMSKEMAIARNYTNFLGTQYEERHKKLAQALKKQEITEKQYNEGVKQLNEDKEKRTIESLSNTFGQAASMFEQNTIAYKAFASAQAVMDTYAAANMALKSYPPPFNFIAMGATIAAGLVNVAKINGAFANGGIVPGSPYTGDNTAVLTTPGEVILNSSQQGKLWNMLNGGTSSNIGGEVRFEIEGTRLIGVLNNTNRKIKSYR